MGKKKSLSNQNVFVAVVIVIAVVAVAVILLSSGSNRKAVAGQAVSPGGGNILYYSFDSGTVAGNVVSDLSLKAQHGTLVRSPEVVSGRTSSSGDSALSFNYASKNYLQTPDSPSLDVNGPISISVWVKRGAKSFGNIQGIVSKGGNSRFAAYALGFRPDDIYFLQSQAGKAWETTIFSRAQITDSNWHHLVVTNDLTTAKMYLDGSQVGEDASPAASLLNLDVPLTIGAETNPDDGSVGRYLDGAVDEVQIYTRALTASEVSALYEETSAISSPSLTEVPTLSPTPLSGICGDGLLEFGETCDDGNTNAGDGCSSSCIVEVGSSCYVTSGTRGPSICSTCGDGVIEGLEQCDDGNTLNGDGCTSGCQIGQLTTCGNGIVEAGEQCDDGNVLDYRSIQVFTAVSGNNYDPSSVVTEQVLDGCTSTCQIMPGYICDNNPINPSGNWLENDDISESDCYDILCIASATGIHNPESGFVECSNEYYGSGTGSSNLAPGAVDACWQCRVQAGYICSSAGNPSLPQGCYLK